MVKQKTHKASKARFKKTATGKIKFNSPNRRHILAKKSKKRKRQLKKTKILNSRSQSKAIVTRAQL